MKIKDVMTSEVEVVQSGDSLKAAAKKMRDRDVGFLPVYEGGQLIGVVTDRDLTVRALADGINAGSTLGRALMTAPAIHCYEDEEVEQAVRLMNQNRIRRLVVLNRRDNRLAGVISLGDLAGTVDYEMSSKVLQNVSMPVKSH